MSNAKYFILDNGKLSRAEKQMSDEEFMQMCREYELWHFHAGCAYCTGGIVAVLCCDGSSCGCYGEPYDYTPCPAGCAPQAWFKEKRGQV